MDVTLKQRVGPLGLVWIEGGPFYSYLTSTTKYIPQTYKIIFKKYCTIRIKKPNISHPKPMPHLIDQNFLRHHGHHCRYQKMVLSLPCEASITIDLYRRYFPHPWHKLDKTVWLLYFYSTSHFLFA